MTEEKFGMRVSQRLDKTTLVVSGSGTERLKTGDTLLVLAVGQPLLGSNIPLVLTKALVEVDSVTKYYAIARSPEYQPEVSLLAGLSGNFMKNVFKRDPLNVDEADLIGNPAWGPIKVGDPVVLQNEVSAFVDSIAASEKRGERKT